ncbi:MAG: GntR family transcriptional regulator [Propionibacteriaceae bacterium]|nr:GntR family transcriptional regulator [Propionibacteriaceae bacterium]
MLEADGPNPEPSGETGGRSSRGAGVTSALVTDWLRQLILNGDLPPGTRLRQETVAAKAGSSRLPVREALRTLEGEGLVALEPNKGARVTSLDLRELDLLYSTRASLEPIIIADSMGAITDEAIAQCEAILRRIEEGVTIVDFLLLDRDFHLLTYRGCSSQHLLSVVERLWNATQGYRRAFVARHDPEWQEVTTMDHRLIMQAVRRRNSELAAKLITAHIVRTQVALRSSPSVFSAARAGPAPVELPHLRL